MTIISSKPTPAPWETSAAVSADGVDCDVCEANAGDMLADLQGCQNAEANAKRIVACVIACEGIVNPEQSIPAMKRALENLVDCAGITWLPGYKDELDAVMLQAREVFAHVRENRLEPKPQGFVVTLYRSADDDAQMALFPAENLDAAEDWLVQMAQLDGYEAADFAELRDMETRELFSVDIFAGKPGGRMQLR